MKLLILSALIALFTVFVTVDTDLFVYFSSVKPAYYENKVVLITGASSGIGAAFAHDMCSHGAIVVLTARREDRLKSVAETCAGAKQIMIYPMDMVEEASHEGLVKAVMDKFGRIDILVLNAGRTHRELAIDFPLEATRSIFDLNFFSYISLLKHVVPHMKKSGSGQIVVISSIAGKMGLHLSSSYSATKFALQGYFDVLRSELLQHNIKVNIICPGPVASEVLDNAIKTPNAANDEAEKDFLMMPTSRCTHLMAVAVSRDVYETWISSQPYLFFTYFSSWFPTVWRPLYMNIGAVRAEMFSKGENMYDLMSTMKNTFFKKK